MRLLIQITTLFFVAYATSSHAQRVLLLPGQRNPVLCSRAINEVRRARQTLLERSASLKSQLWHRMQFIRNLRGYEIEMRPMIQKYYDDLAHLGPSSDRENTASENLLWTFMHEPLKSMPPISRVTIENIRRAAWLSWQSIEVETMAPIEIDQWRNYCPAGYEPLICIDHIWHAVPQSSTPDRVNGVGSRRRAVNNSGRWSSAFSHLSQEIPPGIEYLNYSTKTHRCWRRDFVRQFRSRRLNCNATNEIAAIPAMQNHTQGRDHASAPLFIDTIAPIYTEWRQETDYNAPGYLSLCQTYASNGTEAGLPIDGRLWRQSICARGRIDLTTGADQIQMQIPTLSEMSRSYIDHFRLTASCDLP